MAKQGAENTDIRSARKKQKRKRHFVTFVVVMVLIIVSGSVFLLRDKWLPMLEGILDKPKETIVNDGTLEAGNFPIELSGSGNTKLYTFNEYFVSLDDSSIKMFDLSGNVQNTIMHTLAHPTAVVSGKRMLIYENGGNSFEVVNKNGELFSKKLDDNILFATMADNITVTVTQTDKYDGMLTAYDENGSEIYHWAANKRIMSVTVKKDGSGCYISTFTSVDGQMTSVIHDIDFDSSDDKMVSDTLETLVVGVCKNDAGDIWAVGDTKLYKINDSGVVIESFEYSGRLLSYTLSGKVCAVATEGITRNTSRLMIFNCDDTDIKGDVEITSGSVKALRCVDDRIFMLSESSAECYDINASLTATAAVSNDYVDFVYLDDALIFIGYRDINKITFKN
ncbi:MAG: hypothetical protein IJ740_19600 [Ruminococcus sp.]|nr:hypothetical protein [Ruminococcus sp.]MBR1753049.1 hypothetical protein [Ruminococcus sp.]